MDPVAAGGFAAAAPTYARIRPTYARPIIGAIKEATPSGGRVLDVAAGTGILSGQLSRAGLRVLAVEPVMEMLVQLRRTLPEVPAVRGVAEALPVRRGTVATLTVGEAFHWFDPARFLAEAARVLAPDGVLVVTRNRRDESVEWVRELSDVLTSERPSGRPYSRDDPAAVVAAAGGFDGPTVLSAANPRRCTPRQLVDRVASFVADAEPAARDRVLQRVRDLTSSHPELAGRDEFELPYVTELWTWRAR